MWSGRLIAFDCLQCEAQGIARRVLKRITDGVYDKLTREGYFYDPVEREVCSYTLIISSYY